MIKSMLNVETVKEKILKNEGELIKILESLNTHYDTSVAQYIFTRLELEDKLEELKKSYNLHKIVI